MMKDHYLSISQRKRILALFLAVTMLWTMGLGDVAGALQPAQPKLFFGDASGDASGNAPGDPEEESSVPWKIENDILTIYGEVTMEDYDSYYEYNAIEGRGYEFSSAPWGNQYFTKVIIEEGVKNIGNYAFYCCKDMTSIEIPASVMHIGENVFRYCEKLETITIADNNTAYATFDGMLFNKEMTKLLFCPAGKKGSVTLPTTVTEIDNYVFSENAGIKSVEITGDVKEIGEGVFSYCTGLESVILPESLTRISANAFKGCKSLKSITLPKNFTEFYNCPEETDEAGDVFDDSMFACCTNLEAIYVDPENEHFSSEDGILYNKTKTELIECPKAKKGTIIVPEGVETIRRTAFYSSAAQSIELPASVTTIGKKALYDCAALESISVNTDNTKFTSLDGVLFNKELTEIICCPIAKQGRITIPGTKTCIEGSEYLYIGEINYRSGITEVVIEEGVTEIDNLAFEDCSGLTSIKIPASVTTIGFAAFVGCSNLTDIEVSEDNANYKSIDGVLYSKDGTKLIAVPEGKTGTLEIPAEVTEIVMGNYGDLRSSSIIYYDSILACKGLTSLLVSEDNVVYQSTDGMLLNKDGTLLIACPGGKAGFVQIPSTVTQIGKKAFYENTGITGVNIPEGVVQIDSAAFYGCKGIGSIKIPSSIEKIKDAVFCNCTSLKKVLFAGRSENFTDENFWWDIFWNVEATVYYDPSNSELVDILSSRSIGGSLTFVAHAEHIPDTAVTENEQAATCTVAGSYDEVVYCSVCGEEISRTTVPVAAIGHSYGAPVFERQGNECVAVFTCEHDDSHTERINCTVTSEVTTEATTLREGVRTYTATAEKEGNTYTYTWTESIEKLILAQSVSQTISKAVNRVTTAISNVTSRISSALKSLFRFGR